MPLLTLLFILAVVLLLAFAWHRRSFLDRFTAAAYQKAGGRPPVAVALLLMAGAVFFAFLFPLGTAMAQTAAGVDVTSAVKDLVETIVGIAIGAITLLIQRFAAKWISADNAAKLNTALLNGANLFITQRVLAGKPLTIDLHNGAANAALQYAMDHEPKIAARVDTQILAEKAASRAATIINGLLSTPTPVPTAIVPTAIVPTAAAPATAGTAS